MCISCPPSKSYINTLAGVPALTPPPPMAMIMRGAHSLAVVVVVEGGVPPLSLNEVQADHWLRHPQWRQNSTQ
jgi:hypothetical protein